MYNNSNTYMKNNIELSLCYDSRCSGAQERMYTIMCTQNIMSEISRYRLQFLDRFVKPTKPGMTRNTCGNSKESRYNKVKCRD